MSRHHPHIPYGKTVTTVKHTSRMHRLPITVATIAALTLAACSSTPHNADPASTATNTAGGGTVHSASGPTTTATLTAMSSASTAPPDPTTTSTATTTTTATGVGTVSQDDLVRFIAATETVLKGTPDEGVVYASPEIYIAIAQSACARFAAGDTLQTVANDLLTQLATTNPTGDKRLVGAILGAATRTICPENSGVI